MQQMRAIFRAEVLDLLIELDFALLALEVEPGDTKLVHRVFRSIHTIKGSGGTAGFAHLARFAHSMEEAFDLAREGRLAVTPDLIDCGLKACDVIRLISEREGEGPPVAGEVEVARAFARLLPAQESRQAISQEPGQPAGGVRVAFEIVFKPPRDMFYSGADPITLLSELRELGNAYITAHTDQIPPLSSLEPEHCYLWWEILLITGHTEEAVRDAFVFVADVCEVRVRLRGDQAAAVALFGSVPEGELDQFVLECEDHVEEIERDALALEKDPAARSSFDSLFRSVHSIKGNAGLLLGHLKAAALLASHPLQLLLRVGHGLESLLEPFRETNGGPAPEVAIQTALETCDAIRALLGSLSHNGVSRPVSPELLERLGVWTSATSDGQNMQRRQAAFFTTTSHWPGNDCGLFPAYG